MPLQSSSTLVWLGALPARETWPPSPLFTQFNVDWANLGRLGTPFVSIWFCWVPPCLHSLAWPGLYRLGPVAGLVAKRVPPMFVQPGLARSVQTGPCCRLGCMTWTMLCRLDPGVSYFPTLARFSLDRLSPVVSLVPFRGGDVHDLVQTGPWCQLFLKPDLAWSLQTGPWCQFGLLGDRNCA